VTAKKRVPKRKAATSKSTESIGSNKHWKKAWARCCQIRWSSDSRSFSFSWTTKKDLQLHGF
jgi:hypothetical protein